MNRWTSVVLLALAASPVRADEAEVLTKLQNLEVTYGGDGDSPGQPIIGVYLCGKNVTDADLKVLAELTSLRELDLRKTAVTDGGLRELASLASLQTLYLDDTT